MEGSHHENKVKDKPEMETNRTPNAVSPVKQFGKISLGFRGFKLINSNIKLLKQVDVKTSLLKQKTASTPNPCNNNRISSISPVRPPTEPTAKLSTADALKKIREKIQLTKKLREEATKTTELDCKKEFNEVPSQKNVVPSDTNGLKKIQFPLLNLNSQPDPQNASSTSPLKKTEESSILNPSSEKSSTENNGLHSSPTHGRSHKSSEPRKTRDRSKSPHHHKSPHSSKERKSPSIPHSSRHRSEHNHRRSSPKKSTQPTRKISKEHTSNHSRYSHSEKRRSWDSENRRNKRSHHRRRRSHSDSKSSVPGEDDTTSTTSSKTTQILSVSTSPPLNSVVAYSVSESSESESIISKYSEQDYVDLPKSEDSDLPTPSGGSSLESEAEIYADTEDDQKEVTSLKNIDDVHEDSESDNLFSKLASTFSTLENVSIEQTEEDTDDVKNDQDIKTCDATSEGTPEMELEESLQLGKELDPETPENPQEIQSTTTESSESKYVLNQEIQHTGQSDLESQFEGETIDEQSVKSVDPILETSSQIAHSADSSPSPARMSTPEVTTPIHTSLSDEEATETFTSCSPPPPEICSLTPPDSPPHTPPREPVSVAQHGGKDDEDLNPSLVVDPVSNIKKDSKVPILTSKLKNVFESILHTDFGGNNVEKIAAFQQINGLKHVESLDSNSDDHMTNSNTLCENNISDTCLTDEVDDKCTQPSEHDIEDSSPVKSKEDEIIVKSPIRLESDSLVIPTISPARPNHISPSNKLKLHATTKTPLPAKKSYIQQVQICNELELLNSDQEKTDAGSPPGTVFQPSANSCVASDIFTVRTPTETLPISESVYTKDSNSNKEEKSDNVDETLQQPSQLHEEQDAENNPLMQTSDLGVVRQDSSGSSPTDTEDGPRRSARIRTKKNEKTRSIHRTKFYSSEPGSSEVAQSSPTEQEPALTENKTFEQNTVNEKITIEMSETDYFKAKIRLAEGTTELPQLFEVLDENDYLTTKKKSRARKEIRRMVCECALEENQDNDEPPCGENCLNRLLMIECSSRCLFADHCTNKRFQQRKYAPTEVFKTDFKGWGIRAATIISAGQLIMEYCGEVVDQREFTHRSMAYSKSNHEHFYFMALSQDEIIDATFKGNSSRFINHSCDPNAETQKWTVNGRLRVGFFTLRNIAKGEEITFDYQFERYGKVAQKCYCGTTKCRGYLGKAPDEEDKKNKVTKKLSGQGSIISGDDNVEEEADIPEQNEKERKKTKKKLPLFEDDTMEKDLSRLLGGLCSSKEVLTLSRLMVRCDTYSHRVLCLQVLKETTSQTRLKTFLQFHGLSIIWSWMVDISSTEEQEAHKLKLDIINTLCMLPINNRNIIEDSKVLSVVQRWAKEGSGTKSPSEDDNEVVIDESKNTSEDVKNDKVDQDKEETPVTDAVTEAITSETEEKGKESSNPVDASTDDCEKDKTLPEEPPVDEASEDSNKVTIEEEKVSGNVIAAASSLLNSWKDLREIYRIPKRQKPSPDQEPRSRDNSHSRTSSPMPKRSHDDYEYRGSRHGRSWRGSSQDRGWDNEHGWDNDRNRHRDRRSDHRDPRSSPGQYSNEGRWESARRKRRFSTDSDDQSLNGKQVPWHCRAPHGSRMSRQEYRKKFEKDMQKREQEKKRRVDEVVPQFDPGMTPNINMSMNSQQMVADLSINEQDMSLMVGQDMSMMGQQVLTNNATFTPSGYSGNLIQINPTPQPQMVMQSYVDQAGNQQMGMVSMMQQPQNSYNMQIQDYGIQGMYSQDPNMQVNMQGTFSLSQQADVMNQQIITNQTGLIQAQQPLMQVQQQQVMQPVQQQQQPQANNVTILGSQNGQAIVLLSAEQLQKLTQGVQPVQVVQQAQPEPQQQQQSTSKHKPKPSKTTTTTAKKKDSPDSDKSTKLPPNWKVAHDAEGRIYYYHIITRQTQWDQPTWDGKEEDMVGKKEAEMDLSSTPTYDERRHKTSKSEASNITEEGKKSKEVFRLKMSKFVVQYLSAYRKRDCKIGRITSTEDFKHVARKLTHNIMLKEIKQVRVWEDLDFNNNVRHKTREYVKKYMGKVGPIYRIRDDNPMDPC